MYACLADGIGDEDYLLTTDADLIPLSSAHFNEHVIQAWHYQL